MKTLELKKDFWWTGVQDPDIRMADIIVETKYGTTYNAFLLKGSEKTALFETSKAKFMDEFMDKLTSLTDPKDIDYIIVTHTEPDHSGSVEKLLELNPEITLVGSAMAMRFMKEVTNMDFKSITVKDGDTLSLGDKTLRFITAVNLHWPDTIFTYIEEDKTLVTCDAFGAHYSIDSVLQSTIRDNDEYIAAAKYYFDCIIGPFKPYVRQAIEKIKDLDIDMIATGHGAVLDSDPQQIIDLYAEWAQPEKPNEKPTVVIPYVSAYGYTETLAGKIAEGLNSEGVEARLFDMQTEDQAAVLAEMRRADGILFGSPTILGEALKPIWDLLISVFPGEMKGKHASAFGAYGWSGEAVPNLMARIRQLRMKPFEEGLRVLFKPSQAQEADAVEFGKRFAQDVKNS